MSHTETENRVHWWHILVGRFYWREFFSSSTVVWYLWQKWDHSQPWQILIWLRGWFCWIHYYARQHASKQVISASNTTRLSGAKEYHRWPIMDWPSKSSVICFIGGYIHLCNYLANCAETWQQICIDRSELYKACLKIQKLWYVQKLKVCGPLTKLSHCV